jgi:ABC-type antimicrobial peptide transport system permease subunit
MALGAQVRDVLWLVLGRGLRLGGVGLLIGSLGALGLARLLASVTPGLDPNAPVVIALAGGLLLTVALVACWIPARRASRVDPLVALRSE